MCAGVAAVTAAANNKIKQNSFNSNGGEKGKIQLILICYSLEMGYLKLGKVEILNAKYLHFQKKHRKLYCHYLL